MLVQGGERGRGGRGAGKGGRGVVVILHGEARGIAVFTALQKRPQTKHFISISPLDSGVWIPFFWKMLLAGEGRLAEFH